MSSRRERKATFGFDEFYAAQFGERWVALRQSLESQTCFGARINPLAEANESAMGDAREVPGLTHFLAADEPFPPPVRGPGGLCASYLMDAASALVAEALGVEDGDEVLDMCAAPGGKSWILASRLPSAGRLVANDRSGARRARLQRVLDDYLPQSIRERVEVTGHDATRWGLFETAAYDRVLVDAPCSSEQHVLADPRARRDWSPARSRQLAVRQYALLAAALDVVRPGGRIVYSTCALARAENDGIIARLLADKKRTGRARILAPDAPFGERTEHGVEVLPDATGWGPIYFAVLLRT